MPTELTNLVLGELSLVDVPANPLAMAPIFKAETPKGDNMTKETDKAEDIQKKLDDALADVAKMKSDNEDLRKALIENGFVITKDGVEKKKEEPMPEYIQVDGEKINKAEVPAAILKKLEDAEKAEKDSKLEKRAKEVLPNFDVEVAKSLLEKDFDEKIMEALMAADAAFEAVMAEKGETQETGDLGDAQEKLDAKVNEVKAEKGLTKELAFAEVAKTSEGRKLIAEAYKKGE